VSDATTLLYEEPWEFAVGDFVQHHGGGRYLIIAHAIEEATGTPVYTYESSGPDWFATWTRPKSEMEDGRFTIVYATNFSTVPEADPLRSEHAELVQALADVALQFIDHNGVLDSGCMGTTARAIRLLARLGKVRLTHDGPGRNVTGVWADTTKSEEGPRARGRREMLWLMAVGCEVLIWQRSGTMSVSLVARHAGWQRDHALQALADLGDQQAALLLGGEK
jgi:hypothetical protein